MTELQVQARICRILKGSPFLGPPLPDKEQGGEQEEPSNAGWSSLRSARPLPQPVSPERLQGLQEGSRCPPAQSLPGASREL